MSAVRQSRTRDTESFWTHRRLMCKIPELLLQSPVMMPTLKEFHHSGCLLKPAQALSYKQHHFYLHRGGLLGLILIMIFNQRRFEH